MQASWLLGISRRADRIFYKPDIRASPALAMKAECTAGRHPEEMLRLLNEILATLKENNSILKEHNSVVSSINERVRRIGVNTSNMR